LRLRFDPFLRRDTRRWAIRSSRSFFRRGRGFSIFSPVDNVAKLSSPTSIPTGSRNETPRFRMYVLWALGARGDPRDFAEFADDPRQPLLQVAALDALAERTDPSSADLFLRVLQETEHPWEAKFAALLGIEKIEDERLVEPLIEFLGKCRPDEGRLKDLYLRILKKRTGADLSTDDPNAWRSAWTARKAGAEPGKTAPDTVAEPTEFYGLKTRSTRIVFLLDHT
jgi:hypothetical protein